MRNLRHLHIYDQSDFTAAGYRSLFDPNDGIRQLRYFRIIDCLSFNNSCIDALTKW